MRVSTPLKTRFTIHTHVMATIRPTDTDLATDPALVITDLMDTATADSEDTVVMGTATVATDTVMVDTADTADMDTVRSLSSAEAAVGPVGASPALPGDGWREEGGIRAQGAGGGIPADLPSHAPQGLQDPQVVRLRPEGRLDGRPRRPLAGLPALRHSPPAGEPSPGRVVVIRAY